MKKSTLLIFLGLVLFLGGVVFIFNDPAVDHFAPTKTHPLFKKIKKDDITQVDISYFTNGTRFKKNNQTWQVASFTTDLKNEIQKTNSVPSDSSDKNNKTNSETTFIDVDANKINSLLDTLLELSVSDPVSKSLEKQNQFQVGKLGLTVKFLNASGEELALLHVGKQGPNLFSTFVRLEGDDHIYLVSEGLTSLLQKPIEEWKGSSSPAGE